MSEAVKVTSEYLVEMPDAEALHLISQSMTNQIDFSIKFEKLVQPISAKIEKIGQGIIYFKPKISLNVAIESQIGTIKFFIGTEVYFIKNVISVQNGLITVDHFSKIIQFKRRKHVRYVIPEKWSQSATIRSMETKFKANARVIDLSIGGIRLEVAELTQIFNKNESLRIQFQIFKRAEVICDAVVKFCGQKTNGVSMLGLEFQAVQEGHKSRIRNVIEDIIYFNQDKIDKNS